MTTQIIGIPLTKLAHGEKAKGGSINSRKAEAPVDGLAKSISTHGLLVPLLVRKGGDGDSLFYVIDGNRRLDALNGIHKDKDTKIPCISHEHNNALELSMVVNVDRAELHPVDRFEVFAALIEAGDTAEAVAKRYTLTIKQVRQALALGRLAPPIRDAWRAGEINAETAEAFAMTSDHRAQAAALKKVGKHGGAWSVRQALTGDNRPDVNAMLAIVGRAEYEKAGHHINETLFNDDNKPDETVSDFPALRHMVTGKMASKVEALVTEGWKWAVLKTAAPRDYQSWKRVHVPGAHFTKEQMATMGCIVGLDYNGRLEVERGCVKPGDKGVSIPKSPKQLKVAAKERAERKEETGGLSNALARRLSEQLTAAVREAFVAGVSNDDAIAFMVAALACGESPMKIEIKSSTIGEEEDTRHDNEFAKYYKLACSKSHGDRCRMLATWLASSIDLTEFNSEHFVKILHPDKDDDCSARILVEQINAGAMTKAALKHFNAADYFGSVSKDLIVEAVTEAMGKTHAAKVLKMKAGEARDFAIKNIKGWVPQALRLGKA